MVSEVPLIAGGSCILATGCRLGDRDFSTGLYSGKHLDDLVHLCVDWLLGVHDLIDFASNCRWPSGSLLWLGHGNHRLQRISKLMGMACHDNSIVNVHASEYV